jgi:acetyl esterase/lipase
MKPPRIESPDDVLRRPPPPADHCVRYGSEPSQFGDLRLPTGRGPHPVAVIIHGGFWRAAHDLLHLGHLAAALTADGVATWNIEYRRVGEPGGGWPGTFEDIGRALLAVNDLTEAHPLDPTRTIAVGFSAGGHLALWAAGRHRVVNVALAPAPAFALAGVVALAPIGDLVAAADRPLNGTAVPDLLGGSPSAVPDRYAAASPRALLPIGVRQIVIHGTDDLAVPIELSESYVDAAQRSGDPAELVRLPGTGHFELIDPRSSAWDAVRSATRRLLSITSASPDS